jgi:UDP-N-acetylmuramate dehydrogenase
VVFGNQQPRNGFAKKDVVMQLEEYVDLTALNTFGLRARARYFAALADAADLPALVQRPEFDRRTVLWLGGGSNVLLMQDYPALVVHMENKGVRETHRSDGLVYIEAQAGEVWHDFVLRTLDMGLCGLENLSLIPGTVGAAPVQNIGAYGVEVKDLIHSVRCFDLDTLDFVELDNADCRFAYRDSLFKHLGKGRYVICAVTFALKTHFSANARYGDLAAVLAERCAGRASHGQRCVGRRVRHPLGKAARPGLARQCGQLFQKSDCEMRRKPRRCRRNIRTCRIIRRPTAR